MDDAVAIARQPHLRLVDAVLHGADDVAEEPGQVGVEAVPPVADAAAVAVGHPDVLGLHLRLRVVRVERPQVDRERRVPRARRRRRSGRGSCSRCRRRRTSSAPRPGRGSVGPAGLTRSGSSRIVSPGGGLVGDPAAPALAGVGVRLPAPVDAPERDGAEQHGERQAHAGGDDDGQVGGVGQRAQRPQQPALELRLVARGAVRGQRRRVLREPRDDVLGEQPLQLVAVEVEVRGGPGQALGPPVRDVRGDHLEPHPRVVGIGRVRVAAGSGPQMAERERAVAVPAGELRRSAGPATG